jgi:hypothetical protein
MKHSAFVVLILFASVATPLAADEWAIANCGPNDGYVTLYSSLDTFEMAARLPCGTQVQFLEPQKSYAAQHTALVCVATEDGKQGYVSRSVIAVFRGTPPSSGTAVPKPQTTVVVSSTRAGIPSEVRVLDGTELEVKLSSELSSDRITEGAIVNLEVSEPLVVGGATIFERGAPAHARITQVKKAARWGHDGEISWTMQDVTAVDGTRIPAHFVGESQNTGSSEASGIVAASGNAMLVEQSTFSLHKGDAALLPVGQIFKVFLHGDTVIHMAPSQNPSKQSAGAMDPR